MAWRLQPCGMEAATLWPTTTTTTTPALPPSPQEGDGLDGEPIGTPKGALVDAALPEFRHWSRHGVGAALRRYVQLPNTQPSPKA